MGLNLFDSMGNAVPTSEVIKRLTEWYDCRRISEDSGVHYETEDLVRAILTKDFTPRDVLHLYTDSTIVGAMDADSLGHIAHAILQNPRSRVTFCWDVKLGVMEALVYEYLSEMYAEKNAGAIMSMKRMVDAEVAEVVTRRMKE